jgi:hypothetical protein
MTWKHIVAGLCGFGLGFWFCMPRDVVLLPRYEVLVSANSRKGISEAQVEQVRQDYAITSTVSTSLATADDYGRAAFPAVRGRTSPLLRTVVCVRQMRAHGLHAPCGFSQQIVVEVPGYSEVGRAESKLPLKGRGRLLNITMRADTPAP